jgi:hypothetical protein
MAWSSNKPSGFLLAILYFPRLVEWAVAASLYFVVAKASLGFASIADLASNWS